LPEELGRRQEWLQTSQQAKADLEKEAKQERAEEVQAKADRAKKRAETHESKKSGSVQGRWRRSGTKRPNSSRKRRRGRSGRRWARQRRRKECQNIARGVTPTRPRSQRPSGTLPIRTAGSWRQGANFCRGLGCQLLVDGANQIIVAQGVTNNAADSGNFGAMVEKGTQNAEGFPEEASPEAVLADSGYWSEDAPAEAEELGTEFDIATGRQPRGKKTPTRSGDPPEEVTVQEQISHKLRTREGPDRYALRKSIVEPVSGQIKEIGGFRRFSLRGYQKVRREWALVCTGHNLKSSLEQHRGAGAQVNAGKSPRIDWGLNSHPQFGSTFTGRIPVLIWRRPCSARNFLYQYATGC